jgi:hypothetical protein
VPVRLKVDPNVVMGGHVVHEFHAGLGEV